LFWFATHGCQGSSHGQLVHDERIVCMFIHAPARPSSDPAREHSRGTIRAYVTLYRRYNKERV
jgi:hypothetical protein